MTRTANAKIRAMDMPVLYRVFDMEGGYVLDFSNRTFAEFFRRARRSATSFRSMTHAGPET